MTTVLYASDFASNFEDSEKFKDFDKFYINFQLGSYRSSFSFFKLQSLNVDPDPKRDC